MDVIRDRRSNHGMRLSQVHDHKALARAPVGNMGRVKSPALF